MTKTPSDRSDEEFVVNLHAAGRKSHASREPRLSRDGRQVSDSFGGNTWQVCVCVSENVMKSGEGKRPGNIIDLHS